MPISGHELSDLPNQTHNNGHHRTTSFSSTISHNSSMDTLSTPGDGTEVYLKKKVGLMSGTALIVGTVIGKLKQS